MADLILRDEGERRTADDTHLRVGHLHIDLAARQVLWGPDLLDLTAKEFDLLAFLAARPGHVFNRDELLRSVWQSTGEWQQVATVTEHVRRLRRKVELDPRRPQLIRTVRGAGYRFDLPEGTARATSKAGSPPPGIVIHVAGTVVSIDDQAAALVGVPATDLVGTPLLALVAEESQHAGHERMRITDQGRPLRSQVIRLRHVSGKIVEVEVESSTIDWLGRKAGRVVLTPVVDQPTRLRQLVTGVTSEVTDPVIITDLRSHVRSWNEAAERLYGWAEHEVMGRHVLDILDGGVGEYDEARRGLATTGRWHGEVAERTRDGSIVRVSSSAKVLHGDAGEPIGVVSVDRPLAPVRETPVTAQVGDAEIREALARDEFEVHYQPVIDLASRRMLAVEALLRWNHPQRGLLGPQEFMAAAERGGSIVELGGFVLDAACTQAAAWRLAGADLEVAVNLSSRELAQHSLVGRVVATLEATGLDPRCLCLEVTETALVEDVDQASTQLHQLAALGVRISIDDFGTGWASLTYLREFPVHSLKIDRTFVEGLEHNQYDVAIARSILSLGAELGLTVIAEGIETEAQHAALTALGCRYGQGYLHGRPTAAADVPIHLARMAPAPDQEPADEHPDDRADDRAADQPDPAATAAEATVDDAVDALMHGLLRIHTAENAAELLQLTAERLGATVVSAEDAGPTALPTDLALGEGPPRFAEADQPSEAREQLEELLPTLADEANEAIHLLRRSPD